MGIERGGEGAKGREKREGREKKVTSRRV